MKRLNYGLILLLGPWAAVCAQDPVKPQPEPLVTLGLAPWRMQPLFGKAPGPDAGGSFSFLVGGHLYGSPQGAAEGVAASFLKAAPGLKQASDRLLVSLGDFVYVPDRRHLPRARAALEATGLPVFDAPGNHEWRGGTYLGLCATDHGCLVLGKSLLVFLNTERDPWFIQGRQLTMLRGALLQAAKSDLVDSVFIFSHKLIWAVHDPRYAVVLENLNARDGFFRVNNFARDIAPLLARVAKEKPVWWFSGDVGMPWTEPLFHDQHPESKVTFVATGLGNLPSDHLLRVQVPESGDVRVEVVPLGKQPPEDLAAGSLDAWRRRFKKLKGLQVVPPAAANAALPGPLETITPDQDRNGVHDGILWRVPVRPPRAGTYGLQGTVFAASGQRFAVSAPPRKLAQGKTVPFSLFLPAARLEALAGDGPMLLSLKLMEFGEETRLVAEAPPALASGFLWRREFSEPRLEGATEAEPGSIIGLELHAARDAGRAYLALASLADQPGIPLAFANGTDARVIPLRLDPLLRMCLRGRAPFLRGARGVLNADGRARLSLVIPGGDLMRGHAVHLAYLVFDPLSPLGVRAISARHVVKVH